MKKITKPNYSLATPADLRALLSVGHCKAVYYEHLAKERFPNSNIHSLHLAIK